MFGRRRSPISLKTPSLSQNINCNLSSRECSEWTSSPLTRFASGHPEDTRSQLTSTGWNSILLWKSRAVMEVGKCHRSRFRRDRGGIWVKLSAISLYKSSDSAFWNINFFFVYVYSLIKKLFEIPHLLSSFIIIITNIIKLLCCFYQHYIWMLAPSAGKPHAARPLIGLYIKTPRRAAGYVIAARYFSLWTPYVVKQSSPNSCTRQL